MVVATAVVEYVHGVVCDGSPRSIISGAVVQVVARFSVGMILEQPLLLS